jgi:lysophospholipase L1-like esterase
MRWLYKLALAVALAGVAGLPVTLPAEAASTAKKKKPAKRRKPARTRASAPAVSPKVRAAAQARVAEWIEAERGLPVENAAALVPFFEQLARRQGGEAPGPLRILHYGDSHTAADEWTGSLRERFQERFGVGGGGYSLAGYPFLGYRRLDLRSGASRGWRSEGLLGRENDGRNGLGGISVWTTRPHEYVFVQAECQRLELFYLRQPEGGSFELYDNDDVMGKIETAGEWGPGYFQREVSPGLHRFRIETLENKPVRLFGWVTENASGVTYEALGINGAQASIITGWNEELLASNLARRDPALIVLAYGTNDAGDREWTGDSYREMFAGLIERLRKAAPAASILVVGPPDRYYRTRGKWLPFPNIDRIVEAQREAALAGGCAFWDLRARMGGQGSMQQWVLAGRAQYDHVHFTVAGYKDLGQVMFQDLMEQYGAFLKARDKVLLGHSSNGSTSESH